MTRVDEALVTVQRTVPSSRMCFVATFGDTALPCSRCGVHRLCRRAWRLFCLSRSRELSSLRNSSMSKCRRCTFLHSVPCSPFCRELADCTAVKLEGLLRPTRTRSKQLDERVATLHLLAFVRSPTSRLYRVEGEGPFQSGRVVVLAVTSACASKLWCVQSSSELLKTVATRRDMSCPESLYSQG